MDEVTLSIGQLASRFGLNASAIRFYERTGVLPQPARVQGRRRYGADAVRRLEVLGVAKRAGFSLDEAAELVRASDTGGAASESLRGLAAAKLSDLDAQIADAQARRRWMRLAAECECADLDDCDLFAAVTPRPRGPAPAR